MSSTLYHLKEKWSPENVVFQGVWGSATEGVQRPVQLTVIKLSGLAKSMSANGTQVALNRLGYKPI